MPVISPQIKQGKKNREDFISYLASLLPGSQVPNPPTFGMDVPFAPSTYQDAGRSILDMLVPQPEDTLIAPAELRPNFRSPQQIQALRRMMAEEQRARGPLADAELGEWVNREGKLYFEGQSGQPIDQILRGSWYHGMSEKARGKITDELSPEDIRKIFMGEYKLPGKIQDERLPIAINRGFPISAHDAQSISNKLGEPAGVSLSLNPTVSGKFSSDENIFRVMPLYGGPPTERTVNLMTSQGRNALNDAYDVVANKILGKDLNNPEIRDYFSKVLTHYQTNPNNMVVSALDQLGGGTGKFNQQLSNQLQNQGYRHILYNPKRWDEYEMLALDPKYALPLDYRNVSHYLDPVDDYLAKRKLPVIDEGFGITPKAQQSIQSIQDIMATNHSRLGDIYKERTWWDRLSEPVKEILLRDNPKAESIIEMLSRR